MIKETIHTTGVELAQMRDAKHRKRFEVSTSFHKD
jgi:hypothetical protein